jgi:hypothetical protein
MALNGLNNDTKNTLMLYWINTIIFLIFICFSLQTYGQGGPPMLTDDPGTVDKGHLEINSGITFEHSISESLFEFPFIDINYGVNGRQHINFEVPIVSRYVKGIGKQIGIGKFGFGTKFRFVDQDYARIDISTHPAYSFVLSNKAVDKGIIDEGAEFFIPIEIQKDFNKNILGIELGRLINIRSQDLWTYGALYAREFNPQINAAVEINGNSSTTFNETTLYLNLGARMTMTQRFKILLSAGKSIVLPEGAEDIYIGYLALQIVI